MKRTVGFAGILKAISAATVLLSIGGPVSAQQKPPVMTGPTTSSVQVTPRNPSPYAKAPAGQTTIKLAAGTISGYVYWDLSAAHYKLSSPCQGLTVNVSTISKPQAGGGQVLATTSNFTPWGPVTDGSKAGFPQYMLCTYTFFRLPVGEYLRVRVAVEGTAFSPGVSVQNPPDFEIPGGNCNNTPPGLLSFILTGGEMVCGNGAFNINLKLFSSDYVSPGRLPARSAQPAQPAPR